MTTYCCPECNAALNVNGNLVLTVKNAKGNCGLLLLSDKLGDYTAHHHPNISFEKGERVRFYCPVCKGDLTHSADEEVVRIFMEEDGEESVILFSAIFGENATYQVTEEREKTYGEMLAKFKHSDWYLKVGEDK